jgi:hypothetical protein
MRRQGSSVLVSEMLALPSMDAQPNPNKKPPKNNAAWKHLVYYPVGGGTAALCEINCQGDFGLAVLSNISPKVHLYHGSILSGDGGDDDARGADGGGKYRFARDDVDWNAGDIRGFGRSSPEIRVVFRIANGIVPYGFGDKTSSTSLPSA